MEHQVTKATEKIVVNEDFSIDVPRGFAYKTSQWKNDPDEAAVITEYKKGSNQTKHADDLEELFSLSLSVKTVFEDNYGNPAPLIENVLTQTGKMLSENYRSKASKGVSETTKMLINTDSIRCGYTLIRYHMVVQGFTVYIELYHVMIATSSALYDGSISRAEEKDDSVKATVEKLLLSIEPCPNNSVSHADTWKAITEIKYNESQYYSFGEVSLPIPDGMYYAAPELDKRIPNGIIIPKSEDRYAFIVSGNKILNPSSYRDARFGYSITQPSEFDTKFWYSAPLGDLVKQVSDQLAEQNSNRYGVEVEYDCLVCKRFFIVLASPFMHSDDPPKSDDFWMSIVFSVITKSKLYTGTAFINGSIDGMNYASQFKDFLMRIQAVGKEDINDDGLLENPRNLKNLIEAFGGTVVDWPGKDELGPNEDVELEPELIEAIDEASKNTPAQFKLLAAKLKKKKEQWMSVKTSDEAIEQVVRFINDERGFSALKEDYYEDPLLSVSYIIPEVLVKGEYGFYQRKLDFQIAYSVEDDGKASLKQIVEQLYDKLLSLDTAQFKEMLTKEAKRAKLHDDPLVSRRAHLMGCLPASFKLTGTEKGNRIQNIESVRVGDEVVIKSNPDNKDYRPVAIEVFDKSANSLGFLAGARIQGFRDNALEDVAFIADCLSARVTDVTPLSARKKGSKYALVEIELSAKKQVADGRPSGVRRQKAESEIQGQTTRGNTLVSKVNEEKPKTRDSKRQQEQTKKRTGSPTVVEDGYSVQEYRRKQEQERRIREEELQKEKEKHRREIEEQKQTEARWALEEKARQKELMELHLEESQKRHNEKMEALESADKYEASLISRVRAEYYDPEKQAEIDALRKKLEQTIREEKERIQSELISLDKEISRLKTELETLGVFRAIRKKTLRLRIAEHEKRIVNLKEEIKEPNSKTIASLRLRLQKMEEEIESCDLSAEGIKVLTRISNAFKIYRGRLEAYYDYKNADVENRPVLISREIIPGLKDRIEEEICSMLKNNPGLTIEELQKGNAQHSVFLGDFDNGYLAGIVRSLTDKGIVSKRVTNGQSTLFCYKSLPSKQSKQPAVIYDIGWDVFSKPAPPEYTEIVEGNSPYLKPKSNKESPEQAAKNSALIYQQKHGKKATPELIVESSILAYLRACRTEQCLIDDYRAYAKVNLDIFSKAFVSKLLDRLVVQGKIKETKNGIKRFYSLV